MFDAAVRRARDGAHDRDSEEAETGATAVGNADARWKVSLHRRRFWTRQTINITTTVLFAIAFLSI